MRRTTMLTLLSVSVFLAGSRAVSAQTDHGALVSGQAAVAVTGWTTAPAISAFIGYRFNRAMGIGVEITSAPSLEPDFERDLPRITLPFGYDEPEGALTVFTTNVRVEIPTVSRRVVPYVVGGGGLSSTVCGLLLRNWRNPIRVDEFSDPSSAFCLFKPPCILHFKFFIFHFPPRPPVFLASF
jgi:hypothetical protein